MSAPQYVPRPPAELPRVYQSPPRRAGSWTNDRPADFNSRQPLGPGLGTPGPDGGYVLKLANQFRGQLNLAPGEHEEDAIAGCIGVALKRSSLFGRAPVVHDLRAAFTLWGYLGEPDPELIAVRRPLFEEASHHHHYLEKRQIADAVPEHVLRMPTEQIIVAARDWRAVLDLSVLEGVPAEAVTYVSPVPPVEAAPPPPPPPPVAEPAPVLAPEPEPVAAAVAEPEVIAEPEVADVEVAEPEPEVVAEPEPAPEAVAEVEAVEAVEAEPVAEVAAPPVEPLPTRVVEPLPTRTVEPEPQPEPVEEFGATVAPAAPVEEFGATVAPAAPVEPAVAGTMPPPPAEADEEPARRQAIKPIAIPRDVDPDEVGHLLAEAKAAFRRKKQAQLDAEAQAQGGAPEPPADA